jgi:hypothetical protein
VEVTITVKQIDYMTAGNMPPGHYVFYRRIEDTNSLIYEVWNSKTKAWNPHESVQDAFLGLDVYADPIEESEVLRIIEQSN